MPEVQEVFRMATQKVKPDPGALDRQLRGQRRRSSARKGGVYALVAAIVLVAVVVTINSGSNGRTKGTTPGTPAPVEIPDDDYFLDLTTGAATPLPDAITRGVVATRDYAVSPDGTKIAYTGVTDDGTQIFVANVDGSDVRQLTNDGDSAEPTFSPDSSTLAFGSGVEGEPGVSALFVVGLASERIDRVTPDGFDLSLDEVDRDWVFSPDGSAILFSRSNGHSTIEVRSVPVTGGRSEIFLARKGEYYGTPSFAPDGSMMTFGHWAPDNEASAGLWVANADGTDQHVLVPDTRRHVAVPHWSPDGRRIVGFDWNSCPCDVLIVDVATGEVSKVGEGWGVSWFDDHTLIIER